MHQVVFYADCEDKTVSVLAFRSYSKRYLNA